MRVGYKRFCACGIAALICAFLLVCGMGINRCLAFGDEGSGSSASSAAVSSSATASSASQSSGEPVVADDPFADAVEVDMEDGSYLIDVSLAGGSGRASLESPAAFEVSNGRGVVKVVWSSEHYDYMLVGGKKYLRANTKGNSLFVIPVLAYDEPMIVVGDTTAMGEPHEVSYEMTVSRETVQEYDADKLSRDSVTALNSGNTAQSGAQGGSQSGVQSTAQSADQNKSQSVSASAQGAEQDKAQSESASTQSTNASAQSEGLPWPWIVFIVCAILSAIIIGITIGLLRSYRG